MKAPAQIRSPRDLSRLESWFRRAICTPESRFARVAASADQVLTSGPSGSARERLLVYVRDYWARCLDSLKEDFPGLAHLLGDAKFRSWMERYLIAHPSRSHSLRDLGDRVHSFFSTRYSGRDRRLMLDMIRYEWAKIEAFDRADRPAFNPNRMTDRQRSRLAETHLAFQPHISLLHLEYPVYEIVDRIWKSRGKKARISKPRRRSCYTLVYRRDRMVYHRELERPFFLLLSELQRGRALAEACGKAVSKLAAGENRLLEKNAQVWFGICVTNRWLCQPKGGREDERDRGRFTETDEFSVQNRLVAAAPASARRRVRLF